MLKKCIKCGNAIKLIAAVNPIAASALSAGATIIVYLLTTYHPSHTETVFQRNKTNSSSLAVLTNSFSYTNGLVVP